MGGVHIGRVHGPPVLLGAQSICNLPRPRIGGSQKRRQGEDLNGKNLTDRLLLLNSIAKKEKTLNHAVSTPYQQLSFCFVVYASDKLQEERGV